MIMGQRKNISELEAKEVYSIINLGLYMIRITIKIVKLILNVSFVRVTTLLNTCLNAPYSRD